MTCPRCPHDNPDAAKFCGGCGGPLEATCPSCRTGNPPGNKFCHECGTALGSAPRAAPAGRAGEEAAPRAIEELYAQRIAEHYEVLAHHFSRAEAWDKALDYLLKAAKKTVASFGIREALALYEEALAVTRRLGEQAPVETLMTIHRARSDLFFSAGEYPAARTEADRLLALARRAGDRTAEATALIQSANAAQWLEDFDGALSLAQEAVTVSEASGDQAGIAGGLSIRGFVLSVQGRLDAGTREIEPALAIGRSLGNPTLHGETAWVRVLAPIWQGRYEEALAFAGEGVRVGREHRLVVPLIRGLWGEGVALAGIGGYEAALRALDESLRVAERIGDERNVSRTLNTVAWLRIDCGDVDAGLELGARSLELARRGRHATGSSGWPSSRPTRRSRASPRAIFPEPPTRWRKRITSSSTRPSRSG